LIDSTRAFFNFFKYIKICTPLHLTFASPWSRTNDTLKIAIFKLRQEPEKNKKREKLQKNLIFIHSVKQRGMKKKTGSNFLSQISIFSLNLFFFFSFFQSFINQENECVFF